MSTIQLDKAKEHILSVLKIAEESGNWINVQLENDCFMYRCEDPFSPHKVTNKESPGVGLGRVNKLEGIPHNTNRYGTFLITDDSRPRSSLLLPLDIITDIGKYSTRTDAHFNTLQFARATQGLVRVVLQPGHVFVPNYTGFHGKVMTHKEAYQDEKGNYAFKEKVVGPLTQMIGTVGIVGDPHSDVEANRRVFIDFMSFGNSHGIGDQSTAPFATIPYSAIKHVILKQ